MATLFPIPEFEPSSVLAHLQQQQNTIKTSEQDHYAYHCVEIMMSDLLQSFVSTDGEPTIFLEKPFICTTCLEQIHQAYTNSQLPILIDACIHEHQTFLQSYSHQQYGCLLCFLQQDAPLALALVEEYVS